MSLQFDVPEMNCSYTIDENGILLETEEGSTKSFPFTTTEWTCEDTTSINGMAYLITRMCAAAQVADKWNLNDSGLVTSMEAYVKLLAVEIHKAETQAAFANRIHY